MTKGAPIFFRGPGTLLPHEEELGAAAREAAVAALAPIAVRFGGIPTQNALISVWIEMSLAVLGVAETDRAMRLLRRDLPRFAAALRAAQGPGGATSGGPHDA